MQGYFRDELRTNLEKTYLIRGLQTREIMRNVSITEEELRQYYKANQKQFMRPPSVTVREILVSVPTETVAGQQTVNAAADEAARALQKYLNTPLPGLWYDKITVDGTLIEEPAPASTFYHIVCAISEMDQALKRAAAVRS
jgi:hypothetical protein